MRIWKLGEIPTLSRNCNSKVETIGHWEDCCIREGLSQDTNEMVCIEDFLTMDGEV